MTRRLTLSEQARILTDHRRGMSQAWIAEKIGRDPRTVRRCLRGWGIA